MTIPRYYISSFEEEHIVYNTRNRFEHPTPRSISITEGRRVEVSYNLLDVSEVLKVEFYSLKLHHNLYESVTKGGAVSVGGSEVQPCGGR